MNRCLCGLVALGLLVGVEAQAEAQYVFAPFDVPGSVSTMAYGINDSGQIVGGFGTATATARETHGFLLSGGTYTTIDITNPALYSTTASSINNAGEILGIYTGGGLTNGGVAGFLLSSGSVSSIVVPSPTSPIGGKGYNTSALGLNSLGQVVGIYTVPENSPGVYAFLYSGGLYTTLMLPGSASVVAKYGINDLGQIVGTYIATTPTGQVNHGFLLSDGTYSTLDLASANAINNVDQIVGTSGSDGFLLSNGNLTMIDVPGATQTVPLGINNLGDIVGYYVDANRMDHGFLATPIPEPSTLLLLAIGTLGLIGWARRRR